MTESVQTANFKCSRMRARVLEDIASFRTGGEPCLECNGAERCGVLPFSTPCRDYLTRNPAMSEKLLDT